MTQYFDEALGHFEYTRRLRRDFHRHPELGFQEVRTAGIVARELNELGLEVTSGVGKTGVVALLEGARPGPVVLVRFDMDALPVQEETGAEYASQTPGVMHACGHDGHTAVGLTVAKLLHAHAGELAGSVKFVFQPAEEGLGGAEGMISDGVLRGPRPDYALALHIWNEQPVGWMAATPGPFMAASEIFRLRLTGRGGHGALPHTTIDPLLASAHLVTALQSIVSRNVSPFQPAVISFTSLRAGETHNVIPSYADLQGTIRTYDPAVRQRVLDRFKTMLHSLAEAFECQLDLDLRSLTPAVVNDPAVTRQVQAAAGELFPGEMLDTTFQTSVSEDMAYMLQEIPGCYFMLGSANAERGLNAPHHHPRFDIDEAVLPRAAALMAASAARLLVGG
jgi:amidohydrolase